MKFSFAVIAATLLGAVSALPTNTDLVVRGSSDLEAREPSDLEARQFAPRPKVSEEFKITNFYLARSSQVGPIITVTFTITAQWEGSSLQIKCVPYLTPGRDGKIPPLELDVTYQCGKNSPFWFKYVPKFSKGHEKQPNSRLFIEDHAVKNGMKRGYAVIDSFSCQEGGPGWTCSWAKKRKDYGPFITLSLNKNLPY